LAWLLPLLPESVSYVEPFGGSAAVLLNRRPAPLEVYNDLNGEAVNFFRVLRERPDDLVRLLSLTPYAREEFEDSLSYGGDTALERARKFFVRARSCWFAHVKPTPGMWSRNLERKALRANGFSGGVASLGEVAGRLLGVQIENRPALQVIRDYDREDVLFYVDPPYEPESRRKSDRNVYSFEMDAEGHRELAAALNSCKGMAAVSGYDSPLMGELYPPSRWTKTTGTERRSSHRGPRTEVLWTNYDPAAGRLVRETSYA
jgi:DNA adenine methylase